MHQGAGRNAEHRDDARQTPLLDAAADDVQNGRPGNKQQQETGCREGADMGGAGDGEFHSGVPKASMNDLATAIH
jgi:hypothetical protein